MNILYASRKGDFYRVKKLLAEGVNVDFMKETNTPLIPASEASGQR